MATLHSTKFQMLDKEKQLRTLQAEITDRNGYNEFTMSGEGGGHAGQCDSSIVPANPDQQAIIDFRNKWHLNGMSSGTPNQEALLAKYPEIKDYNERVELLSSVKITGESLNFAERKQIESLYKDIDDIKKISIPALEDIQNKIEEIDKGYEFKQGGSWIRTSQEVFQFIKQNRLDKSSIALSPDKNAIYVNGGTSFRVGIRDKSKLIIQKKIEELNNEIENIEMKLTTMFAYYVMHEGKVYKYGHGWIRKGIHDHDKFRADFLKLVDKAKYIKDDKPVITEESASSYLEEFDHKCVALAVMLGLDEDELADLELGNGNRVTHYGTDYLVGTDDEMAQEHLEDIKSLLDDCGFDGFNQKYVDTDVDLDDDNDVVVSKSIVIKSSERANTLNRRDGSEETCEIDGETYYAYRQ